MNYAVNSDGSYRLDKIGRRIALGSKSNGGRPKGSLYTKQMNLRLDGEMYDRIMALPKGKRAYNLRVWIEWGLENDK